jgi:asparagine synthase (glutamine-hydrolysing)
VCGIAGWVSTRPEAFGDDAPARLAGMCAAIRHRGPDDDGTYLEAPGPRPGGAALGFRRLSIVDLSGGHQPMANEDGQVWTVFNGEIYNHAELRRDLADAGHRFATDHSDTEVLVHGWEQWGVGLLPRLSGMFDFAVWDAAKRSLLLARDRHGKKPLFVGVLDDGATLVFGSELVALLAHPAVPRRLDPRGLEGLLLLDYAASPRTLLADVVALEPGSYLLWQARDDGSARLEVARWHVPEPIDPVLAELDDAGAVAELDRRLRRAVERRLMADVPLGVFLSGGIDSSLVAAYARELRPDLATFAIGFEEASFDESPHARAVARHLGTRHHEHILSADECLRALPGLLGQMDQPLADASILPTWFLCGFARPHVTVALGGDGGDEWWLGYPTFVAHRLAALVDALGGRKLQPLLQAAVDRLPVRHGYMSLDFKAKRFVTGLGCDVGLRHFAWIGGLPASQVQRLLSAEARTGLAQTGPLDRLLPRPRAAAQVAASWAELRAETDDDFSALAALYARFYLADDVLQKVDRASMLHGLEVRAPLLDHEVVALARALPTRHKLRRTQTKRLLRQLARQRLPAAIVDRPKQGFAMPLGGWLRGPLRGWLTDMLAPARLGPWLEPNEVNRLVREHLDGHADHRKPLWALLSFASWQARVWP